jgi:hypothetical protein
VGLGLELGLGLGLGLGVLSEGGSDAIHGELLVGQMVMNEERDRGCKLRLAAILYIHRTAVALDSSGGVFG